VGWKTQVDYLSWSKLKESCVKGKNQGDVEIVGVFFRRRFKKGANSQSTTSKSIDAEITNTFFLRLVAIFVENSSITCPVTLSLVQLTGEIP